MSVFLSDADMKKLTGRLTAPAQIRVLKRRGIPYTLDADDKPVVMAESLLPKEEGKQQPEQNRPRLHFPKDDRCASAKVIPISHAAST